MNVNDVQRQVLQIISEWVKTEKTPILQQTIIQSMVAFYPMPQSTVKASIHALCKKGYIRKTITGAKYVQLRSL